MDDSDFLGSYLAIHAINLFPGLLREELLSDSKLLEELSVGVDVTISFGGKDKAFSRNSLFKFVRSAFENHEEEFQVEDVSKEIWVLRYIPEERYAFSLTKGDLHIVNDSFWLLCGDVDRRLKFFEAETNGKYLSSDELNHWRLVLSATVVSDDDVSNFLVDMDCTPAHIEDLLWLEFKGDENKISTLVPDDIRYYERLVGKYYGSKNIYDYCNNELKQYFKKRIKNDIKENDLFLCMHKSISSFVLGDLIDEPLYQSMSDRAIETCHPILLISCLEIGVLKFADSSVETIKQLFENLSSAKALENLRLFCSMVIFVDGELARLQIFSEKPAFYRRLASFAQAALITKVAMESFVAWDKMELWALQQRGLYFFCQSFVDLREEPRWLPTYLTAEQFRDELYGRVSNICQEVGISDVVEYLQRELRSGTRLNMNSFLSGPLEGNTTPALMPDDISKLLNKDIDGDVSLDSYRALMNSARFWKIDDEYLERAVSLLEKAQHKLAAVNDKDSVYQVLSGLAQVSCMTRSRKLATSVMVLSRIYRDYIDVDSEPENYLAIGIIAGAAFEEKDGWSEYIGKWCTELAYLPIGDEAIGRVRKMLEKLCILEPYLYYTCSKALDIFKMLDGK